MGDPYFSLICKDFLMSDPAGGSISIDVAEGLDEQREPKWVASVNAPSTTHVRCGHYFLACSTSKSCFRLALRSLRE